MPNPYAPPESRQLDSDGLGSYTFASSVRRDGKLLVVPTTGALPARCVRCNSPAVTPMRTTTFKWHSRWWYLLIFAGLLIYVIASIFLNKKAVLTWGLCPKHNRLYRIHLGIAWMLAAVGAALIGLGVVGDEGAWMGFGVMVLILAGCYAVIGPRVLLPAEIDDRRARFTGCGDAFLADLDTP